MIKNVSVMFAFVIKLTSVLASFSSELLSAEELPALLVLL